MSVTQPILFWLLILAFISGILFGFALCVYLRNRQSRHDQNEAAMLDFNDIRQKQIKNILRVLKGGRRQEE